MWCAGETEGRHCTAAIPVTIVNLSFYWASTENRPESSDTHPGNGNGSVPSREILSTPSPRLMTLHQTPATSTPGGHVRPEPSYDSQYVNVTDLTPLPPHVVISTGNGGINGTPGSLKGYHLPDAEIVDALSDMESVRNILFTARGEGKIQPPAKEYPKAVNADGDIIVIAEYSGAYEIQTPMSPGG
jgi:hypothetical protein